MTGSKLRDKDLQQGLGNASLKCNWGGDTYNAKGPLSRESVSTKSSEKVFRVPGVTRGNSIDKKPSPAMSSE